MRQVRAFFFSAEPLFFLFHGVGTLRSQQRNNRTRAPTDLCSLQMQHVLILVCESSVQVAATVKRDTSPPVSMHSQTRKYWVPPENVNQVKALIVRHLPVLVYGKSSKKAPELSILTKGEAVQTSDGQVSREGLAQA